MRFISAAHLVLLALLAAAAVPSAAQTSVHYRLAESAFNAGGDPRDADFAESAHHKLTLDAIGDAPLATSDPQSASHR